ncbi:MAG: hypothetical protein H6953_05720 [Chromatiaceae bacterium]|nr:hypothetical protein [Chromatiaceae bacterium]MCP5314882.1 hypothetical protein [Chromatiaceae bacterium]
MNWISRIIEGFSAISRAGDLLLLSQLQDRLAGAHLPDGADDILALLRRFRSGGLPTGAELEALLAVLEIDQSELERLVAFQRTLDQRLGEGPARLLSLNLRDVAASDTPPLRLPITAPLPVPIPDVEGFTLLLGAQAEAALVVDASPEPEPWFASFALDRCPVLVHFSGTLKGEVKAGLPLHPITLSGRSAAALNTGLRYWFLNRSERRWGRVLVDNAARLGDALPLDLARIHDLLDSQELLAMRLDVEGQLDVGGEIAVSLPMELLANTEAALGVAVGFSAHRAGSHSFVARQDAVRPGNVLLSIVSGRTESSSVALRLGIQVDFSEYYQAIKPQLARYLGSAATIVEELKAFTEPSEMIRERATAWLNRRAGEAWFRDLALAGFGIDAARPPAEVIAGLISHRIETTALKWEKRAEAVVGPLAELLLADLDLSTELRPRIEAMVLDAIDEFIEKAGEAIAAYVKSSTRYKQVAKALDEIGEGSNDRLRSVDARADELRRLLSRYQQRIGEIGRRVEEATEVRLSARIAADASASQGTGSELELSFRPDDAQARTAWRQVLTGDLRSVVKTWGGTSDGPVQVLDGRLSRFARRTRGRGFDVVLLDLQLSGRSILDTAVRVEADARGNVLAVVSRASVEQERSLLAERRTLRFVESSRLALASLTSDLDLDLTLSHGGNRLDPDEAQSILRCFAERDLLSQASAAFAAGYLQTHPQEAKEAELIVRMRLTDEEVRRLLGVGMTAADLADRTKALAAEEIGWAIDQYGVHNPRALLAFCTSNGLPGTWAQIIRSRQKSDLTALSAGINDQSALPSGFNTVFDFQNALDHAAAMIDLRDHLVGLLLTMQEVHGLAATEPDWDPPRWQEELDARQRIIAEHVAPWVEVSLFRMIRDKARPLTIALFRCVLRLAGRVPVAGSNIVRAEIKVAGRPPRSLTEL